jgi:Ca2+-binding EF-hand superfamily protein
VSKAEMKLAHKQLTMKQIEEIMRLIDENHDGHISLAEFNSASSE